MENWPDLDIASDPAPPDFTEDAADQTGAIRAKEIPQAVFIVLS